MVKTVTLDIHRYKTYRFDGQDPCIETFKTLMEKQKLTRTGISEDSGVSKTTIGNWITGKTKKPQFATIQAAVGTMGKKFELRPLKVNKF